MKETWISLYIDMWADLANFVELAMCNDVAMQIIKFYCITIPQAPLYNIKNNKAEFIT